MYKTHQKAIARWAKKSPDNFIWVVAMVLLSIQQQWDQIGKQLLDLVQNGLDCKYFFGAKKKGWEYILANKKELHKAVYSKTMGIPEKLMVLASIPNIDIIKAGFVLQLCIGKVFRRFRISVE